MTFSAPAARRAFSATAAFIIAFLLAFFVAPPAANAVGLAQVAVFVEPVTSTAGIAATAGPGIDGDRARFRVAGTTVTWTMVVTNDGSLARAPERRGQ